MLFVGFHTRRSRKEQWRVSCTSLIRQWSPIKWGLRLNKRMRGEFWKHAASDINTKTRQQNSHKRRIRLSGNRFAIVVHVGVVVEAQLRLPIKATRNTQRLVFTWWCLAVIHHQKWFVSPQKPKRFRIPIPLHRVYDEVQGKKVIPAVFCLKGIISHNLIVLVIAQTRRSKSPVPNERAEYFLISFLATIIKNIIPVAASKT